jgi:hypothetical protein
MNLNHNPYQPMLLAVFYPLCNAQQHQTHPSTKTKHSDI